MPEAFRRRNTRLNSFKEQLAKDQPNFLADLRLARKVGLTIAPLLSAYRISTNFSDPAHCRVQEGLLTLLVDSASQENRIRQLKGRLLRELALAQLPITEINVHIVPTIDEVKEEEEKLSEPLPRTVIGAATVAAMLPKIKDDRLRETFARLSATLSPDPSLLKNAVEEQITTLSLKIAEDNYLLNRELARKETELTSQKLESSSSLNARQLASLEAIEARLAVSRQKIQAEIEKIHARIAKNDEALERLSLASQWVATDPTKAAHFLVDEASLEEKALPDSLTTSSPSIKGAMAIQELLGKTENFFLRRSLAKLQSALLPSTSEEYAEALERMITTEMEAIEQQLNPPQGKKRLERTEEIVEARARLRQLTEGLAEMKMHLREPADIAQALYQFSIQK